MQLRKEIKKLIELSYLKIHNKTHLFAKLYSVIGRARQSKIYEVMDEVEKLILKYCLRSRVSKPNKEKGKDYPTLIADLIKADCSEMKPLRCGSMNVIRIFYKNLSFGR